MVADVIYGSKRKRLEHLLSVFIVLFVIVSDGVQATQTNQERGARYNLMSFDALGHDIGLGLDVEMPFVRMPVGRRTDPDGKPLALLNVNIGAVLTSALIAGGGMLVSYLFRSMGLRGRADGGTHYHHGHLPPAHDGHDDGHGMNTTGASQSHHRRLNEEEESEVDILERQLKKMFDALKIVYRNSTNGERVSTTMPQLYAQLEDTFAEQNIDLQACLSKSVCGIVQRATYNMQHNRASGIDKLFDGLSNWQWLDNRLRHTALGDAIAIGRIGGEKYQVEADDCVIRYASCQWAVPHEQLMELWQTYVRFT